MAELRIPEVAVIEAARTADRMLMEDGYETVRRAVIRAALSAALPHLLAGLAEDEAVVERGARAAFEDRYPNEDWEQLYAVQRDTWRGNFAAGLDALRAAAGDETDG